MDRPKIPAEIKRQVRQRCGFGCVICGAQLYDYDHIKEYSQVKEHDADNLTLLCKYHHGEKTAKNLPVEEVINANLSPYNLQSNTTKSRFLYYSGKSVEVHLGRSKFEYENLPEGYVFTPLQIDDKNIISFKLEDDKLLLTFSAYDENNNLILSIVDNEIQHSSIVWDAEWTANRLSIREANRKYLLKLEFLTPNVIKISKGHFHYNNTFLLLDRGILFHANNQSVYDISTKNCKVGICILHDDPLPYTDLSQIKRDLKKILKRSNKKNI